MEVWITATVNGGSSGTMHQIRLYPRGTRIGQGGEGGGGGGSGSGGGTTPSSFFSLGSNVRPFAQLAGSAITCTNSTVTGDIGVSPGTAITGFPGQCTLNGNIISTADTAAAKAALDSAYASLNARPCAALPALLNGRTVAPGTYCVPAGTTNLSGTLTLDGAGEYVFRFPSTFITTTGANVNLINGATCGGVNYVVGSSATLTGSVTGNVLAAESITMTGATLTGRALARNAAVTLTTSTMTMNSCS